MKQFQRKRGEAETQKSDCFKEVLKMMQRICIQCKKVYSTNKQLKDHLRLVHKRKMVPEEITEESEPLTKENFFSNSEEIQRESSEIPKEKITPEKEEENYCGNCGGSIYSRNKFCRERGKELLW